MHERKSSTNMHAESENYALSGARKKILFNLHTKTMNVRPDGKSKKTYVLRILFKLEANFKAWMTCHLKTVS